MLNCEQTLGGYIKLVVLSWICSPGFVFTCKMQFISLLITDCVEEIDAQRVLGYALFKDGRNTRLSYPLQKFHADVAGRSFHNGRFIQRMREKAATIPK